MEEDQKRSAVGFGEQRKTAEVVEQVDLQELVVVEEPGAELEVEQGFGVALGL